jgi:long-chain acyl-CoA synthetase
MMNLTHALRRSATLFPERTATIFADRRRGWMQVQDRVARLGAALTSLGVRDGDRIAVLALNSDRYFEIYYAALWAGAVIVPLNTRWAIPEHVYALDDSGPEILFVDANFADVVDQLAAQRPLRHVIFADDGETPPSMVSYERLIDEHAPADDKSGQDHALVAIFYTGGTTGRSKGVMLSHYSLMSNHLCSVATVPMKSDQIFLHAAPMFHLADACMVYGVTLLGGTHAIVPSFTPQNVVDAISRERVTDVLLVPTMLGMVREYVQQHGGDLSSVTALMYGASAISETLVRQVMELFPNAALKQAYGQSELSPIATLLTPEHHRLALKGKDWLRSAGQPMVGVDVRIVDPAMRSVPTGAVGEIAVRSPGAMLGYWNQPELTAQTIIDGWLRTGDAGYMDEDGFLYVVDRVKDMIISGGENVYSAEVENALASLPGLAECAVIGVPDKKWGERVHAIIRLAGDACADEAAVIAHCKTLIADFKCPRSVEFRSDRLPMSAQGKILKSELRKPYWDTRERNVS